MIAYYFKWFFNHTRALYIDEFVGNVSLVNGTSTIRVDDWRMDGFIYVNAGFFSVGCDKEILNIIDRGHRVFSQLSDTLIY